MLTAVRQLAAADFIARAVWIDDESIELAECDPPIVAPHVVRMPAAWAHALDGVNSATGTPRSYLPSVILQALPSAPAFVCVVHAPLGEPGQPRDSSLVFVWLDAAQVPTAIRADATFLQHLLVGRTPGRRPHQTVSAARLDAIMAHVPQGIIFVDYARGEAMVNASAARFLRLPAGLVTRDELRAAMLRFFPRLRHHASILTEAERIAADPEARVEDWTWELDEPDGLTLRVTSVPIVEVTGRGRLWTFDDVSHERALLRQLARHRVIEDKLRQMQKLEIVGQLAASIAHDFNNLLTIIGGSAEMLEDVDLDADRRADLHNIGHATERARRLTRQLLTFTRQQVEQSEAFVIDDRLRDTASLLGKVLAPGATLALQLHADGAHVFADPGQIELALMNLLANARDAMPEGGQVTLRTGVELLTGERVLGSASPLAGPHVAVSVLDTGLGFDDTTRERMFEPFFTTKPAGQGTGLGLATVLAIAQRTGGGVRCESRPGSGTVFTVLLPYAGAMPVPTPAQPDGSAAPAPPSQRILLVDDDPGPRDTMRRLLMHEGFAVEVADSGATALRRLAQEPCDLAAVVTDYMMPHMSGRALLEHLRQGHPDLPAVIVSGFAPDEDTAATLTRLRAGFLAKPFTGRQLAAMVRQQIALAARTGTVHAEHRAPD